MFKSFYLSKDWRIWSWGGLLTLIISLFFQVRMTVAINTWYGKFYDLLQNAGDFKNNPSDGIQQFYDQLISLDYILNGFEGSPSFTVIVFPYIVLA